MNGKSSRIKYTAAFGLGAYALLAVLSMQVGESGAAQKAIQTSSQDEYRRLIEPLIRKYCLSCHSSKVKKSGLDLERYTSSNDLRKDIKPWQHVIEQIEAGQMPPQGSPQPTAAEKKRLLDWTREFLDKEARSRSGDPGYVPLRRLSNAEYDYTIRDLTGVDLRPTREFPPDGAAGEGFTNAAEALTEISPTLLTKYLNAAKEVADHAVLLPDGIRFSPGKTRRDWTDESTARLQRFYARYTSGEGRLDFRPYLLATVRYRDALIKGKINIAQVVEKEKLNAKYFGILFRALYEAGWAEGSSSPPLRQIGARWKQAEEKDVPALVAEIAAWQNALWQTARIGNYFRPAASGGYTENLTRQIPNNPTAVESIPIRLAVTPTPGQNDVTLRLTARELSSAPAGSRVLWQRPRFEAAGKPPLLLRDYAQFGPAFEIDYSSLFTDSAKYLLATAELANDRNLSVRELARRHQLDSTLLKRWSEILALAPVEGEEIEKIGQVIPTVPLQLLNEKIEKNNGLAAINGWRNRGAELPALLTNASDTVELIPGTASPHSVVVHPTPQESIGVVWKSPMAGRARIAARIKHAHPNCGNGVAWWLDHRRGGRTLLIAEDAVALGGESRPPLRTFKVEKDDQILLAVDARNGDHSCDLTDISLTITELEPQGRVWDLAADIADNALDSNPHADRHGNQDTWAFVRGPSRTVNPNAGVIIPSGSLLGRWRDAVTDPARHNQAPNLADEVELLLAGKRPSGENNPDRLLYDNLVSVSSALFQGVDVVRLGKPLPRSAPFGLKPERFGPRANEGSVTADDLLADANSVTELRLPASLFHGREFVVEGRLILPAENRAVQFNALASSSENSSRWDGRSLVVASPKGAGYRQLLQGNEAFRRLFPLFLCFPAVIPTDEVVSLKMFHREDEPLIRLFLDDSETKRLDRLWTEHRFISRQAIAENAYLPQFIGFVTQDQPKEMVTYFEHQRAIFKKRAEEFQKEEEDAAPKQWNALLNFTARAYRRPCTAKEKTELLGLYRSVLKKGVAHEEALRGTLARVLVSPSFLFRIEQAPPGRQPGAVNDWELATRLSYFLWSSLPDNELRRLAAAGRLHEPKALTAQVERMLKDERSRALAIEFGTQWIHVRGFDEFNEKNEKLFPTFDVTLRKALYEEAILFFQDMFRSNRPVTRILDADYTFLNETLAKHYGIPGVTGAQWRRVEDVRRFGRGGVLGLASVQAKQAGASRTSPILRGNWVVETLLGEKLPRPPANVPQLPEEEGGTDNLTMKQLVEKHTKTPSCASCHQRIDPFGFALENYDPIGRYRQQELGGLPIDSRAKLRDGTEFTGIDGLRTYLLTKKKDVLIRLFCRRLLGYALGRSVTLSDTILLDKMVASLKSNDGKISAALRTLILSPQFRMVRGSQFEM